MILLASGRMAEVAPSAHLDCTGRTEERKDSPLGKSLLVTQGGAKPHSNDLGGYSILQAESKEALAESLKGHPHFMMPEGFIEVVDLMPIPGM